MRTPGDEQMAATPVAMLGATSAPPDATSMDADGAASALLASRTQAEAFKGVFDAHFRPLSAYLSRRLGESLAEEIAAETFARAFDVRHRYDPTRGTVRAWLHGIAANLVRDHYRDETRRLRAYARLADRATSPGAEMAASDERMDAQAAAPAVAEALAALRRQEREVLLLFAWAELSYEEIAQALGIRIGTVRSRLWRARARVRAMLEEMTTP